MAQNQPPAIGVANQVQPNAIAKANVSAKGECQCSGKCKRSSASPQVEAEELEKKTAQQEDEDSAKRRRVSKACLACRYVPVYARPSRQLRLPLPVGCELACALPYDISRTGFRIRSQADPLFRACSKRKSKCDGQTPSCAPCVQVYGTECIYDPNSDHRRKGVYKKDIYSLQTRNLTLRRLIQAILNRPEDEVPALVREIRTCESLDEVGEKIVAKENAKTKDKEDDEEGGVPNGAVAVLAPIFESQLYGKVETCDWTMARCGTSMTRPT